MHILCRVYSIGDGNAIYMREKIELSLSFSIFFLFFPLHLMYGVFFVW